MDDILSAFRDFLASDDSLSDPTREANREIVHDALLWRVFEGSEPRGELATISATLDDSAIGVHQGVSSVANAINYYVDVTLWCKDTDETSGRFIGRRVSTAMVKMLAGYRGPLNDDVTVQFIFHRNGPDLFELRAGDASGNWKYQYLMTFVLGVTTVMPVGVD